MGKNGLGKGIMEKSKKILKLKKGKEKEKKIIIIMEKSFSKEIF